MIRMMFCHAMKLLLKGKRTVCLLLGGMVLMLFLVFGMNEVKEEKSKITIGVTDEDASALSALVTDRLHKVELFEIIQGEKEMLLEQLSLGELSAVCVIRDGYEEAVAKGKTDDLILVYQTEEGVMLLTDMLAVVMMEEICSAKGYQMLASYLDASRCPTLEEYRTYVSAYLSKEMFDFSFDISYRSGNDAGEVPGNEIVYVQAIFAIAALIMSFLAVYAVLPYQRMLHGTMQGRIASLPVGRITVAAGNAMAAAAFVILFALAFVLCFAWRNGFDFFAFLSFLVCTCMYVCVIVTIMVLAGIVLRSECAYQVTMLVVVLLLGICGLFSIVDGILLPEGMSVFTPNGWYVREMTEIYLR